MTNSVWLKKQTIVKDTEVSEVTNDKFSLAEEAEPKETILQDTEVSQVANDKFSLAEEADHSVSIVQDTSSNGRPLEVANDKFSLTEEAVPTIDVVKLIPTNSGATQIESQSSASATVTNEASNVGLDSLIKVGLDDAPSAALGGPAALGLQVSTVTETTQSPTDVIAAFVKRVAADSAAGASASFSTGSAAVSAVATSSAAVVKEPKSISEQISALGKNLVSDATPEVARKSSKGKKTLVIFGANKLAPFIDRIGDKVHITSSPGGNSPQTAVIFGATEEEAAKILSAANVDSSVDLGSAVSNSLATDQATSLGKQLDTISLASSDQSKQRIARNPQELVNRLRSRFFKYGY